MKVKMRIISLKINPKVLLILLVLVPIFKPASFETFHALNVVIRGLKVLSLLIMLLYAVVNINKNSITVCLLRPVFLLGVFWIIYVFNSIRFHSVTESLITNAVISVLMLINVYFIVKKNDIVYLIQAIDFLFSIWVLMQIVSLLIISDSRIYFGMTGRGYNYFLGLDNYSAFAVLPMIGILMYFDMIVYDKIRVKEKVLACLALLSHVYVKSATAMLALAIFIILLIIGFEWKQICKHITVRKIVVFLVVLWLLIYFFDIQSVFVSFLTSGFIGKESNYHAITLNSRTIIWQYAINLIRLKPILGYGTLPEQRILDYALYGVDHCHNIFLEILFRTGIIGSVCYFIYLFYPFQASRKRLNKKGYRILFITMISLMIISFMDYYPQLSYVYLLYSLAYFEEYIDIGIKECRTIE